MKNKKILFLALFFSSVFLFSGSALAADKCMGPTPCPSITDQSTCNNTSGCSWGSNAGSNTSGTGICAGTPAGQLCNPLKTTDQFELIGRIIGAILGLVGSLALVMFIYGGIIWMTSGGSADKVKKGREAILWSVIGMAVIFASYGLTQFLLNTITGQ